jgi:hypothetical protein
MKTKIFRPFLLTVSAAAMMLATPLRAAIPSAENLLPENTLLLITTPDCAAFRAAMHQSPQWLMWNDPAMKPFHDHFMAKWNEQFIAPIERDLGVKFADFENLPQGQLTFAVTQDKWNGTNDEKPGILLLLDAQGKSDLLKTNLDQLRQKWTGDGKSIRTENIRGIKFSIVSLSSNNIPGSLARFFKRQPVQVLGQKPEPEKPGQLVIGQFQSLLIAGSSVETVEPVAAHLTGSSAPALRDNPVFAADKTAQFRNSPLYYGWFNAKTVFGVLAQIPPEQPNPEAPDPMPHIPWHQILDASGLLGLQSACFSYYESHDGSQANFFLSLPDGRRSGIFKIFNTSQKDASPPAFVPADAIKFWRWRMDGKNAWAALQSVLSNISPAALSSLNSVIDIANATAQQRDPAFDIRKNLIGNLEDDWISYQKAPAGDDLANVPSLFLFAAANPDEAALALKNVASMMSPSAPQPREFLGKKIYTIPLPSHRLQANGTPAPGISLYCAASGGYVGVTKNSSMLENYLRSAANPPTPLRDTAGLANAAQHVGGMGGGLFGYDNQREAMRVAFKLLKNSANDAGTSVMPGLPSELRDLMDFSLLPDFGQISKYFYFSVYAGSNTPNGFSFKVFAPHPPQVN